MKKIMEYFLPVYLDPNSPDPDEIENLNRSKVFIYTFILFSIISLMVGIINLFSKEVFLIQSIAQIFVSISLLSILQVNKYKNILIKSSFVLYLALYSFFYYKLNHYQTIQSSIIFWFTFVPVVISYTFTNFYAKLSCLTGIVLTIKTFYLYDLGRLDTLDEIGKHNLIVFFVAALLAPILVTTFFIMVNNSAKKWREKVSNNIKENTYRNHMASLGEVAGGIAHEINNPLAIIKALSSRIQKESDPNILKKRFLVLDKTINRITDIVDSLLKLYRNENIDEDHKEKIESFIQGIDVLLKEKIFHNKINVEYINKTKSIQINPSLIGQLCLNLMNNSIQELSEKEEGERNLIVLFEENENSLEIKIQDNGKGFKPGSENKIFEPFYSTKAIGEGTGLGLALCYKIVNYYGGKISAHNNNGALIKIMLPTDQL